MYRYIITNAVNRLVSKLIDLCVCFLSLRSVLKLFSWQMCMQEYGYTCWFSILKTPAYFRPVYYKVISTIWSQRWVISLVTPQITHSDNMTDLTHNHKIQLERSYMYPVLPIFCTPCKTGDIHVLWITESEILLSVCGVQKLLGPFYSSQLTI